VDDRIENLTFTADSPYTTIYGYILVLDVPPTGAGGPIRVTVSDGRLSTSKTFQLTVFQPTVWAQILWPWSGVGLLVAAILLMIAWELFLRFPHTLEDVFIIGREGRLILHNTRRLRADRDEDILAGMLTASSSSGTGRSSWSAESTATSPRSSAVRPRPGLGRTSTRS